MKLKQWFPWRRMLSVSTAPTTSLFSNSLKFCRWPMMKIQGNFTYRRRNFRQIREPASFASRFDIQEGKHDREASCFKFRGVPRRIQRTYYFLFDFYFAFSKKKKKCGLALTVVIIVMGRIKNPLEPLENIQSTSIKMKKRRNCQVDEERCKKENTWPLRKKPIE